MKKKTYDKKILRKTKEKKSDGLSNFFFGIKFKGRTMSSGFPLLEKKKQYGQKIRDLNILSIRS